MVARAVGTTTRTRKFSVLYASWALSFKADTLSLWIATAVITTATQTARLTMTAGPGILNTLLLAGTLASPLGSK